MLQAGFDTVVERVRLGRVLMDGFRTCIQRGAACVSSVRPALDFGVGPGLSLCDGGGEGGEASMQFEQVSYEDALGAHWRNSGSSRRASMKRVL